MPQGLECSVDQISNFVFIIKPMSGIEVEDYNWKFPTRENTMFLSTIQRPVKRPQSSYHRKSLDVSDIEGTQSKYLSKRPVNRPVYTNFNSDIQGAQTKPPKVLNVQDRRLKNSDIEGASPVKRFTTTRNTNPLNPVYLLSKVQYVPPEQPPFIRDSICVDDIAGTKTRPTKVIRNYIKEEIKQKQKPVIHGQDYMNVKDINLYKMKYVSSRVTNPLEPHYEVNKIIIGDIVKSKPPIPLELSKPDLINNTGDIEGTWPRRFFNKNLLYDKRSQIPISKQTNYVKDIVGTSVASKKQGISSNRMTNPLQPRYQYPGHTETSSKPFRRPMTAVQRMDSFIS